MLATLQLDQLLPLVGDSFSLATEQGSVHAELIQAKACSQAMKGSDREPFSLLFRLAPGVQLPQRMYPTVHHDWDLGNVFLVPVQPDAQGNRMEAIFN